MTCNTGPLVGPRPGSPCPHFQEVISLVGDRRGCRHMNTGCSGAVCLYFSRVSHCRYGGHRNGLPVLSSASGNTECPGSLLSCLSSRLLVPRTHHGFQGQLAVPTIATAHYLPSIPQLSVPTIVAVPSHPGWYPESHLGMDHDPAWHTLYVCVRGHESVGRLSHII